MLFLCYTQWTVQKGSDLRMRMKNRFWPNWAPRTKNCECWPSMRVGVDLCHVVPIRARVRNTRMRTVPVFKASRKKLNKKLFFFFFRYIHVQSKIRIYVKDFPHLRPVRKFHSLGLLTLQSDSCPVFWTTTRNYSDTGCFFSLVPP